MHDRYAAVTFVANLIHQMKTLPIILSGLTMLVFAACSEAPEPGSATETTATEATPSVGQSGVKDDVSNPNIVQVAVSSKDHSTLVTAVQAAGLVDALSNAGPFTVFAPTNDAFAKLPAGTVEGLLEPDKKADLSNILEYHVTVGVYKTENLQDGQSLGQVNGGNIKITKKDGEVYVNDNCKIIASVPASNGIIHVIDQVMLPK
jgi:uncharacterized surface protein with fasciclin (FAS1) repeats